MTTTRFHNALPVRQSILALLVAGLFVLTSGAARAEDFGDTLHDIQHRWAAAK